MASEADIAIVGMALRVPGARDYRTFFDNLRRGVESIERYSEEELLAAGEDPELLARANYVRAGAPLPRMEHFDGEFFEFSPKESAILDPQHRQFFECAWEALEDAGRAPESLGGRIGVFAGSGMGSYFYFNLCSNPELVRDVGAFLLRHTGNDKDFLATRTSYLLNLNGPSLNVQTACSTSLVAVHLACQSLLSDECDLALVGGVTIELPHRRGYLFRENEILSPDGHCHAFDHRAAGTVFGSGVGVVALRPLSAALADGDPIHAVIRGSAINNDGAGKAGYLAPSVDGQASAVAEALGVAGVSADSIGYVECHGTGTYLGDPIEIAALTQAYRESTSATGYCRIGSVKSNIGHTDTAAGVIGLIKAALCLEHRTFVPSLNFEKPNPAIDFDSSPFFVNAQAVAWPAPATHPRRAAVNSLGVGGTNAHVILEEPPEPAACTPSDNRYELLALSAKNRAALDESCDRLAAFLETQPEHALADVAYTLKVGRRAFGKRRVLACKDRTEAISLLRSRDAARVFTHGAREDAPALFFMFPGGGAQYPQMARGLYESEPLFRETVERGLAHLRPRLDYDLEAVLFPAPDKIAWAEQRFHQPSVQLPAIFIIEYALARLLIARGFTPRGLIGHSMGENTAACVAEVFSFEAGIDLVHLRGTLFDGVARGGMLSVPLPPDQLLPLLGDELDLASINAPGLCAASGPLDALAALAERLAERGVEAQRIPIDIAAHSRMLDGILAPFRQHLRGLELRPPKIPFISNRTGRFITQQQACDPEYWVEHLRNTVHFADGIISLGKEPGAVLVEVGPGKTLGSLARQSPAIDPQAVVSSLRHPDEKIDDGAFLTTLYGRLWALGVDVPVRSLWPNQRRRRVPLPTYAFQGQRYFIEPGHAGPKTQVRSAHPERLSDPERWYFAPIWRRQDASPEPATERLAWLCFVDETGVGARLVSQLRARGEQVITVHAGDTFHRASAEEYWLPPEHGADGYHALVRELLASGSAPNRIVHSWLLSDGESFRPGSSFLHRNQERGFFSLLFLAQALAAEEYPRPLQISVITRGMQRVGEESLLHADQATVLGPCRVIERELPQVSCKSIDLPAPPAKPRAIERLTRLARGAAPFEPVADVERALLEELLLPPGERTIALRGRERWVERHEHIALAQQTQRSVFRRGGVYLITGGFGGVSLALARMLAREHAARLILVGRTPLPARDQWEHWLLQRPADPLCSRIRAVQQLEATGAEVLVASADVADADRMAEVLAETAQRFGALHGVFHSAGTLDDGLIAGKRQASVESVFGPKVYGTLVLDQALRDQPLDFFVVFSSTSALIGGQGQVDYAAANAFLDHFAAQRRAQGSPVQAVSWGIWSEIGMAASAAKRLGLAVPDRRPEQPAQYAFLDLKALQPGGLHTMRAVLAATDVWFLDEHRTAQGHAVLPGTGYLELARAALRETGEPGSFEIADLFFFRPFYVPDDAPRSLRIQLKTTDQGFAVDFHSRDKTDTGVEGWLLHAQAELRVDAGARPIPLDIEEIEARCSERRTAHGSVTIRSAQAEHLAFGPRWQVLQQVAFGDGEALAHLALPERFVADLESCDLHPALLDIATGFALERAPGYGAGDKLWVPVAYRRLRVFAALPSKLISFVKIGPQSSAESNFANFDVVLTDEDGQVVVVVEGFTMRRLDDALDVTRKPARSELELDAQSSGRELSAAELAFGHNLRQGLRPDEGLRALQRVLANPQIGHVVVSTIELSALDRQASELAATPAETETKFSRPQLDSDYVAPRTDTEKTLAGFWENLLGVSQVGIRDDFFTLGGHSLIAVRLFAKIKKTYQVDYPISILFEAPTIEACAKLIADASPMLQHGDSASDRAAGPGVQPHRNRYAHLVPMHGAEGESGQRLPFFLVAGMFGNVLNLRHLAQLVGSDRPFYGLQARGLHGDQSPHDDFVEMARDYIAELRGVQPHGPYLLGGFSGGGITAYEMARQLREAGERISLIAMLDTPLSRDADLNLREKLTIHQLNLKKRGLRYPVEWAFQKWKYKTAVAERENELRAQAAASASHDFRSRVIEAAFYDAVEKYDLRAQPVHIALFRPKLRPAHQLGPGSAIDVHRRRIYHDNGWGPFVERVDVFEVPGDHDSMVLEPNVRVLAARLRESLDEAERTTASTPVRTAKAAARRDPLGPEPAP